MQRIGNISDARLISVWVNEGEREYGRSKRVWDGEAPEGWEYLDSGSFRSVWRSPDGIVYKVQHNPQSRTDNQDELDNLAFAHSKGAPEGARLPRAWGWNFDDHAVVIAMEWIRGVRLGDYRYESDEEYDRLYDLMNRCESRFHLLDLHDENVIVDENGYLVPVDFGI